jgi:hypothetical protein
VTPASGGRTTTSVRVGTASTTNHVVLKELAGLMGEMDSEDEEQDVR